MSGGQAAIIGNQRVIHKRADQCKKVDASDSNATTDAQPTKPNVATAAAAMAREIATLQIQQELKAHGINDAVIQLEQQANADFKVWMRVASVRAWFFAQFLIQFQTIGL
jgi:hypothetical protein